MAVTILSQPDTHTPGYNDQYFVATSTNTNQTNFRYVVAVTVGPDTITEKFNKRPDNGLLYFDPARIVQSYLDNTFERNYLTLDFAEDSIIYVTVGITEEYGSPVSGFAGVSGSYYAWNAAYNTHDFSSYSYSTTAKAKDLTTAPSLTETINYNQKFLYKIWHKGFGTTTLYEMYIEAWDTTGLVPNMIQSATIRTPYDTYADYRHNLVMANISPVALNNIDTALPANYVTKITDPTGDVIPVNTSYYTIYWRDSAGPPVVASNTYTINIDTMCYKYDRYVLHFLNRLGNYDSFTFELLSRNTSEKAVLEYKKNPFENVSNSLVYYNDSADAKNYSTTITNKMVLNSDWITDAQAAWLKDMIMSPSVILEDSSGNLFAVKITDTSWESKLKVNDRIFNATVNLEYRYQSIRQRG